MKRVFAVVVTIGLAVWATTAGATGSRLSIGLGQGVADGYNSTAVGPSTYLSPSSTPETNVGAEYWRDFGDGYAFALAGAYGFSSMKWSGASPGDPEIKATGQSFKARVGIDRTGKVGDNIVFFMGPGLEYWSGKQKLDVGGSETESERTNRIGVSGRIGGFMMLSENVGIMGQVGHTFGRAKAKESGAESSWWPSSFNASWGLTFGF